MSKKNMLIILFLWTTTIIIVLYNFLYSENGFFANGTILIGWFLFVFQYTLDHSEKIYMHFQRGKSWISNHSNQWDFQFEFNSNDLKIEELVPLISEITKVKKNIDINLSRSQITTENGLKIEISKDIATNKVVFQINDLLVPYRESKEIIDNEVHPIVESISQKYTLENVKYILNINLKDANPYYGFLLKKKSDNSNVTHFQVKLKIGSGRVDIINNRVIISASKYTELARITKDYLTFKATS